VPAEIPVTIPADVTVAIEGLRLLQTPPVVESPNVVVLPIHIDLVPLIEAGAEGKALTIIAALPVMVLEQVVVGFVAVTVYDPAVVFNPKLMGLPFPAIAVPVLTPANLS